MNDERKRVYVCVHVYIHTRMRLWDSQSRNYIAGDGGWDYLCSDSAMFDVVLVAAGSLPHCGICHRYVFG